MRSCRKGQLQRRTNQREDIGDVVIIRLSQMHQSSGAHVMHCINYVFRPCCLIHVSWLQLMRVFIVACSSRAMNQPTNPSINHSIVLRRSCPARAFAAQLSCPFDCATAVAAFNVRSQSLGWQPSQRLVGCRMGRQQHSACRLVARWRLVA